MELAIAIIGSSVVATLVTIVANRHLRKAELKKKEAEVAEIVSKTYSTIINDFSEQVDRLKKSNDELEKMVEKYKKENADLHRDVKKLLKQLKEHENEKTP